MTSRDVDACFCRSIGRGAFGEVYQGQLAADEEDGTPSQVAVKVSVIHAEASGGQGQSNPH